MSNLDFAKIIIKANYARAPHGIFNTQNIIGDYKVTLYRGNKITIDWCPDYEYFEVFGLTEEEFKELSIFYESLGE